MNLVFYFNLTFQLGPSCSVFYAMERLVKLFEKGYVKADEFKWDVLKAKVCFVCYLFYHEIQNSVIVKNSSFLAKFVIYINTLAIFGGKWYNGIC